MLHTLDTHFAPANSDNFLKHLYNALPNHQSVSGCEARKPGFVLHKTGQFRVPRYPKVSLK